jgi:D-3-phosphoglycerate dehydrogenase
MGQAFAKKLRGFDVDIIYHDLKEIPPLAGCSQVPLSELQNRATVLSLHLPQTPETKGLVNTDFINEFQHPFWLLNTGRGSAVVTADLVRAIEKGQIRGAGLDVLEYETSAFESFLNDSNKPEALRYLMESNKVILSPHVAGWTNESHEKLAKTVVEKIATHFGL